MSRRKVESMSFLYGNNTQSDLTAFHAAITASLKATGRVPPELADVFVAVPTAANPDGSPRFMIYTIEDGVSALGEHLYMEACRSGRRERQDLPTEAEYWDEQARRQLGLA